MTTTDSLNKTSPTTDDTRLAGVTLRRWTCGTALILFPALLVVQALITPEDGEGAAMYTAATEHRTALLASAALLIISGVLMAPAAVAITHQARSRGSALANWAAVTAVLGGIGHIAIGYFYVISSALAGGDRTEMVAFIERLNASPALGLFVFPFIMSFSLGVLLLTWAAHRAGLIGLWGPIVTTIAVLQHLALPPSVPGQETINTLALISVTVVLGYLGTRVLRMSDTAWAPRSAH
ncbi:MAG: hypothetical protein WCA30_03930 [Dermatophilaceae bacterium]